LKIGSTKRIYCKKLCLHVNFITESFCEDLFLPRRRVDFCDFKVKIDEKHLKKHGYRNFTFLEIFFEKLKPNIVYHKNIREN
jgi:hypothetical protein